MAFIELAPHNRGKGKRYDRVAGCLIAFACRFEFYPGRGPYMGWLALTMQWPDKKEEIRLMAHYCTQYKAKDYRHDHPGDQPGRRRGIDRPVPMVIVIG